MNPESLIIGSIAFGSILDKTKSLIFLQKVFELGIRDIDTGKLYGNGKSELIISEYIQKYGNKLRIHTKIGLEKNIRKDGSFGVKISDLNPEYIVKNALESFKIFNEEKIHRISIHAFCNTVPVNNQLEGLNHLIENNIIKNYGICNFNLEQLSHWIDICLNKKFPLPSSLDLNFNLLEQRALIELFPILESNSIKAIPYRVFCRGILADRYKDPNQFPKNSRALVSWRVKRFVTEEYLLYLNELRELALDNKTTVLGLVLKWTLSFKCISKLCLGTSSISQLTDIVKTLKKLKDDDESLLNKINETKLPKNIYDLPKEYFET